jgi:hypothetical protein
MLTFLVTEVRVRMANNLDAKLSGTGKILTFANDANIPTMSLDTFLFMTRHGSELSIIDGYVVDISAFIEHHPGGSNVLKFAVGSDVTPYFTGALEIFSQRHRHSSNALKALRSLVKWKLECESIQVSNSRRSITSWDRRPGIGRSISMTGHVFRSAEIVGHEDVSASNDSKGEKRIIKLSISMELDERMDILLGTPMPTSTFIFRHVDSAKTIERPYSAAGCYSSVSASKAKRNFNETVSASVTRKLVHSQTFLKVKEDMALPIHARKAKGRIVYEFFIALVPGGEMSSILAKKKIGKHIMVKGPMADMVRLFIRNPFLSSLDNA